jgi:hypothetical protein
LPERGERRTQYEGKNLLRIVLAMILPAFLLYLRLVASVAYDRTTPESAARGPLLHAQTILLIAFVIVQILSAIPMAKLFGAARNQFVRVLQYLGALAFGTFFSICAAVLLQAFGYQFLLRVKGA